MIYDANDRPNIAEAMIAAAQCGCEKMLWGDQLWKVQRDDAVAHGSNGFRTDIFATRLAYVREE